LTGVRVGNDEEWKAWKAKTNPAEIAEILRAEIYYALNELSEYDPANFEAANEEYLARIGAGKPEAQMDRNGTFSPSGADLEKGL
jgi:hypothetical protein